MGTLKIFLVIFILSLSKKFLVKAEDGFLTILQPRSQHNGTVYEMEVDISSEIYNSGYGNSAKATYRLEIIPYGVDKVYVLIQMLNVTVQNGEANEPVFPIKMDKKKPLDFLLTSSGKVIARKKDHKGNWNFYKTISNFLLFDFVTFNKVKKEEISVFSVNKPTIYGRCDIQGMGRQSGLTNYTAEEFFDPRMCSNFKTFDLSDVEGIKSGKNLEINNYRKYNLFEVKDILVLNSLQTSQKIFWKPTSGKSLTHFLQTSYSFTFIEDSALSLDDTEFDFSNEMSLELLTSDGKQFGNDMSCQTLESMENLNFKALIEMVKNEMKKVANIWERHQVNSFPLFEPLPMEIVRTTNILESFELEHIVELWKALKVDTTVEGVSALNTFYSLIPLSGSDASVLFIIKTLTFGGGISSIELAEKMLTKIAGSIRNPSISVLEALREISESQSSAAVLAYTAAVGEAFKKNPTPEVQKFVKQAEDEMFEVIFNSSKNLKKRRVYIQALGNLGSVSLRDSRVVKLLSGYNEETYMQCILALEKSTENVFELMVKIVSEGYRSTLVKQYALRTALLRLSSYKHFEIIARIMDTQVSGELYNAYESAVRALIKDGVIPESAQMWLRHRVPMKRSTGFVYHTPKEFPMAYSIRGALCFNDITKALENIYFSLYQNYNGKPVKMYTVNIRLFNTEKISTPVKAMEQETFSYEFTFYKGTRAIMSVADKFDFKSTVEDLINLLQDFTLLPFKKDVGDIYQHMNLDYFFPTDAGKYAHLYFNIPWMISAKFNSFKVAEESVVMNVLASINATAQCVTGMHIYEPQIEALQGTREISSVIFTEQIAFKLYKDPKFIGFNIAAELTDALTPLFGIRFRKFTSVYMNKLNGEPVASNKDGNITSYAIVSPSNIEETTNDLCLWNTDFGAQFHSQIFLYKAPPGNKEFPSSASEVYFQKPFSDFFKQADEDSLLSLLSYINWNFLAGSAYTYNFKAVLEPSRVFPVKKFVLKTNPFKGENLVIEFKDSEDKVKVFYQFDLPNRFLRIFPGQETTAICYNELLDEEGESIYHISYGTSPREIQDCINDQFQLVIKSKSVFSDEQIRNHNDKRLTYSECLHQSPYLQNWDPTNNYRCAKAATSLRDMTTNINYKNPPKGFLKFLQNFWIWFLGNTNGVPYENFENSEGHGDITIKTHYPMQSRNINIDVLFPNEMYSFELFSSDIWFPDNFAITDYALFTEFFNPSPLCIVVVSDNRRRSRDHYLPKFTNSWTLVAKMSEVTVSVMKILDDELALQIEYNNQTIQARPKSNLTSSDRYDVTVGENLLDALPKTSYENRRIRSLTVLDTIFFFSDVDKEVHSFVVGYNGWSVSITGSNTGNNYGGCFGS